MTNRHVMIRAAVIAALGVSGYAASADVFQCNRGWDCTDTREFANTIAWFASTNYWDNLTTGRIAARFPTNATDVIYLTNLVGRSQRYLIGTQEPKENVVYALPSHSSIASPRRVS